MSVEAFRIQNFMGFQDSKWLKLKEITLLFGHNASGKSAILRSLLLLRQSLEATPRSGPLLFSQEDGFDFGGFREMVYRHDTSREMSFWFRCSIEDTQDVEVMRALIDGSYRLESSKEVRLRLLYSHLPNTEKALLSGVDIYDDEGGLILRATWEITAKGKAYWHFASDVLTIQSLRTPLDVPWPPGDELETDELETDELETDDEETPLAGEDAEVDDREYEQEDVGTAEVALPLGLQFDELTVDAELLAAAEPQGANQFGAEPDEEALDLPLDALAADAARERIAEDIWEESFLVANNSFLPDLMFTGGIRQERIPKHYRRVRNLLALLRRQITDFLKSIGYLGPIRPEPRQFYVTIGQSTQQSSNSNFLSRFLEEYVATRGILPRNGEQIPVDEVTEWLVAAGIRMQLVVQPLSVADGLYKLLLVNLPNDLELQVSVTNVGFGVSQILPIALHLLAAQPAALLIIEQPELHLHPSAQAELADFLIRATQRQVRLLIETHSEHLLLRLRRRVAEYALYQLTGQLPADERGESYPPLQVDESAVGIYLIERAAGLSLAEEIVLGEFGDFAKMPRGFRNFFADDMKEIVALNQASRQASAGKVL